MKRMSIVTILTVLLVIFNLTTAFAEESDVKSLGFTPLQSTIQPKGLLQKQSALKEMEGISTSVRPQDEIDPNCIVNDCSSPEPITEKTKIGVCTQDIMLNLDDEEVIPNKDSFSKGKIGDECLEQNIPVEEQIVTPEQKVVSKILETDKMNQEIIRSSKREEIKKIMERINIEILKIKSLLLEIKVEEENFPFISLDKTITKKEILDESDENVKMKEVSPKEEIVKPEEVISKEQIKEEISESTKKENLTKDVKIKEEIPKEEVSEKITKVQPSEEIKTQVIVSQETVKTSVPTNFENPSFWEKTIEISKIIFYKTVEIIRDASEKIVNSSIVVNLFKDDEIVKSVPGVENQINPVKEVQNEK